MIYIAAVILVAAAGIAAILLQGQPRTNPSDLTTIIPAATETAAPPVAEDATETQAVTETAAPAGKAAAEIPTETEVFKQDTQQAEQPFLIQITENDPSIAYVLVRMPNPIGLLPLPIEGEYTKTIRQIHDDGTELINVLHLTPNGFWMESANCEGNDCVDMGEVTLENREERVLWNMIICLPHQLSAELITREEALQMIGR